MSKWVTISTFTILNILAKYPRYAAVTNEKNTVITMIAGSSVELRLEDVVIVVGGHR